MRFGIMRRFLATLALSLVLVGCSRPTAPIVTESPQAKLRTFAALVDLREAGAPLHGLVGTNTDDADRGRIVYGHFIALYAGDIDFIAHHDTVTSTGSLLRISRVSNRGATAVWYPGHRVVVSDDGPFGRSITAFSSSGRTRKIIATAANGVVISDPTFSQDGKVFVYLERSATSNSLKAYRGDSLLLSFDDTRRQLVHPALSPDGTLIVAERADRQGLGVVRLVRQPGESQYYEIPIADAAEPQFDPNSNDRIVFSRNYRIWRGRLSDPGASRVIDMSESWTIGQGHPTYSPDGRFLLVNGWTSGEWFSRLFILPGDAEGSVNPPYSGLLALDRPDWQ